MANTLTIPTDAEIERALDILTSGGASRPAAVREAILDVAARQERAAAMRRAVLRIPLGEPDGVNVADELSAARGTEH